MTESFRPAVVKKLDETVVNRIAAGEVIQRPANALKELLENSLDAKSSTIQITVKNGGLKLLQIQDNGTGINKNDLHIVCERFTTSKLTQFEDLNSIQTFGFRGEALASISHVAHLTLITKTADDQCAYKASYEDGKLKEPIKPCAGNRGTQIIVEDLFYNIATRRKSLKSPNEEYAKITDVVSKYSVHFSKTGFTLRKHGDSNCDIKTHPNSTQIENIGSIYGSNVVKAIEPVETEDDVLKFIMKGFMSSANYPMKKPTFLLFINNRLVDSQALRKTLDQVYSLYLPKGMHPFIYISLMIDPKNVDVNVHPTKHEVHFLHEDAIIDKIKTVIELKLTGCNASRIFYTQTKLPGEINMTSASKNSRNSNNVTTTAPNYLIRTEPGTQKLDKFFSSNATSNKNEKNIIDVGIKREIKLTSVLNLRQEVQENRDEQLQEILQNFTFVGAANRTWSIIQHKTELYVCNNALILSEMFYQMMLMNFGNFGVIKFSNHLPLQELISIAVEDLENEEESRNNIADAAATVIQAKRMMLNDYFSFDIDSQGNLLTVPCILNDYIPCPEGLPSYLLCLATEVNWEEEIECFRTFCKETATFYVYEWMKESNVPEDTDDTKEMPQTKWHWTLEHVLYPAVKKYLLPTKQLFEKRAVLQIASLPELYKVFERC